MGKLTTETGIYRQHHASVLTTFRLRYYHVSVLSTFRLSPDVQKYSITVLPSTQRSREGTHL